MIINLTKKVNESNKLFDIEFDLPDLWFSGNQYVHVTEIGLDWTGSKTEFHGRLDSTLVDKNPLNPLQQLLIFHHCQEANYMLYTPTHFQKYKIQRTSLQSTEFKLTLSRKINLQNIHIQLEITDDQPRIQQICPRSLQ